jgi:hypothetical protein
MIALLEEQRVHSAAFSLHTDSAATRKISLTHFTHLDFFLISLYAALFVTYTGVHIESL